MTENETKDVSNPQPNQKKVDNVKELLKSYVRSEDMLENLEAAKTFISDHYATAPKSVVAQVITFYLKDHFRLDGSSIGIVKAHWADIQKLQKAQKRVETSKQKEGAKEVEEEEAKLERERLREENARIREKREQHIAELYDILKNKSGKNTVSDIENAKKEIKELMMNTFWDIEGQNAKTGNPGHLSLKKLPIADYIQKAFNMMYFGGRIWWYDWERSFYRYDSDDIYIHQEITNIMKAVGDGEFYKYNGNITSDKSQIIDMASKEIVYTENPFNKQIGYINARNGVLKLDYENKTVTKMGKRPEYMFSYCVDTIYDHKAVDTEIHNVLVENLGREQTELIYQLAAIAIRDADPKLIPSKIAYLFVGPRNTGKNVVMEILKEFFGEAVVSHIPLLEVAGNKYVKPMLEGKLINLDDELPERMELKESREIKSLTGGKHHTVEPKHVKPYNAVITAIHVFAGNQFPRCSVSQKDEAFWDRWEIIRFDKKQHDVNEDFLTKLLTPENLSGFFNRVIAKLFEIHDHKIKRKWNAESTYRLWIHESSSVRRFVEEMTVESHVTHTYTKSEFLDSYIEWCKARKVPDIERFKTPETFGIELNQVYGDSIKDTRPTINGYRQNCYQMMKRYEPTLIQHVDFNDSKRIGKPEEPEDIEYEEYIPSYIANWYEDENGVIREYEDYPEPTEDEYYEDEHGQIWKREAAST